MELWWLPMNEVLTSERLRYRRFNEEDFADLYRILGDPIVCLYLPGVTQHTEEHVRKYLAYFIRTFDSETHQYIYAITCQDAEEVIGYCGCAYVKEFECNEIKYFFRPDQFGKGYATEAAKRMKQLAQDDGLTHLVGLADIRNIPSQRILEKIGYIYQKTIPLWGETMKYYTIKL